MLPFLYFPPFPGVHIFIGNPNGLSEGPNLIGAAYVHAQKSLRVAGDMLLGHGFLNLHNPLFIDLFTDFFKKQDELIAAVADERVRRTDTGKNDLDDLHQHLISQRMAIGVVDLLEPMDVDEGHAVAAFQIGGLGLVALVVGADVAISTATYCPAIAGPPDI